ncbi:MAG TPA: secretin N-terminal domain-containing protein [Nitrospiraceae bacterium]|jgi:general secretion pathway protein D|nr:secretin N-terminal domain-containing protein [Nitrospiraceae bacterium]
MDRVSQPTWQAALVLAFASTVAGCSMLSSPDAKRGDQHLVSGNWEEAALAYQQALKEDPFDPGLQRKYALARERAAAQHEQRGRSLLKERQIEQALEEFKQALSIEPSNPEHQSGLAEALRLKEARDQAREAEKLSRLGRAEEALEYYARAVEFDPGLGQAVEGIARISEEQEAQKQDTGLSQPVTLRFRNAGLKEVLEGMAKAGGLNLIFDKDVRNDPITISVQDTPFEEAINLILNSNNLFARRVGPQLLLISPNTKQKQEQYQDLMIRTFYLSNAKAKDMLVLLKSMLDSKRMHANEQLNAIVIRDQPEKLQLAEKIILANDRQEPEVLFDVEILEVNRTKNQTYGLNYPKQAGMGLVPPGFTGVLAADPQQFTYRQLTSLGPDSYLFRLPSTVLLDFFKQQTDAKTLAAPKIRVVNNKKAEINIGDKQPILLSTTNVLPGQAATGAVPTTSTVTSIEFRDTGVKLTVEPAIRLANELSLKMKIEVIRIGDQVTLQQSPLIQQFRFGNRSAETILNIKDGETIVLGGLLQEEDRKTRTTIPWIGDLPVIGDLLSSFRTERVTTEVILTITPHIVQNMTPPGPETQAFWSGTEMLYATAPVFPSYLRKTSGPPELRRTGKLHGSSTDRNGRNGDNGTSAPTGLPSSASSRESDIPSLSLKPSDLTAQVGRPLRLDVMAAHLPPLQNGQLTLRYDPHVLEFQSAAEGDLLKQGERGARVTAAADSREGTVELTLLRPTTPLAGNGVLVIVTFLAKSPGVSPLYVEMPGGSQQNPTGERLAVGQGVVRVR